MSAFTGRHHSSLTDCFMCCRQWRQCSRQRTMTPSAPTHTSLPSNWHCFLTSRRKVNVTSAPLSLSLSSSLPHPHLIASLLSSPSSLPPASLPPPSLLPAVQSLQAMSTCSAVEEEDSLGLVSLAAQMAFEVGSSLLLRFLTLPKQKLGP